MVYRIRKPAQAMPDTRHLLRDWTQLQQDTEVCLVQNGRTIGAGKVDTPARDGRVFWVVSNDGSRTLVLRSDGVQVFTGSMRTEHRANGM